MSVFLRSMVPGGWASSGEWPLTHEHMGSTDWITQNTHTKEHEVGRKTKVWTWEELGGGAVGRYNQNIFMHIQNSQRINKNHSIKKFPSLNHKDLKKRFLQFKSKAILVS